MLFKLLDFLNSPRLGLAMAIMLALSIATPTLGVAQEKEAGEKESAQPDQSISQQLSDIQSELSEAVSSLSEKYAGAESAKELKAVIADRRAIEKTLVDKAIEITRKRDSERANIRTLGWYLGKQVKGDARKAILNEVEKKYLKSKDLTSLLSEIEKIKSPGSDVEAMLRLILKKNKDDRVKGITSYSLASLLEKAIPRNKKEQEKFNTEVESLLNDCVANHSGVKFNRSTLGALAEGKLAIMNLKVGKIAPEIKGVDLDGQEFKLSDYRGKVVVIDFWGDW